MLYSFARRDSLVALSGKSGMKAAARKMPQSCIREVEEKKRNLVLGKLGGERNMRVFLSEIQHGMLRASKTLPMVIQSFLCPQANSLSWSSGRSTTSSCKLGKLLRMSWKLARVNTLGGAITWSFWTISSLRESGNTKLEPKPTNLVMEERLSNLGLCRCSGCRRSGSLAQQAPATYIELIN